MRRSVLLAVPFLLVVAAACGGDDTAVDPPSGDGAAAPSSDAETADATGESGETGPATGPPAGLPAACTEAPVEIEFALSAVPEYPGGFTVESAVGRATPIVPNGDGSLDDLDPADFNELGAETDLLLYTQWIGDHPFGLDELGFFGGPDAPPGSVTLGLTVVPTSADGLSTGDVVASDDEFEFDSITTFGSVGVYFQPADDVETSFQVNNMDETQGGTAEVLYVDDEWLCIDWDTAGETRKPDGTYALSGVILTRFDRAATPFT